MINPKNTVALVCHPRGGSTWLAEIITQLKNSVLIDEPLWRGHYRSVGYMPMAKEGKLKSPSKLGFYFDQHIPQYANWNEAQKILGNILKGAYWKYDLYDAKNIRSVNKVDIFVTKFCYGHLLLPWIHQQFQLKSILLHRHPCAVVASQLQHPAFQKIVQNPAGQLPSFRYDDLYKKYGSVWNELNSPEAYLAAIWAIKTKYITDHPPSANDCLTLYYEDLIIDFEPQIEKINNHFQVKLPDSVYQNVDKPSNSTVTKKWGGGQQLEKWKSLLSNQQIENILYVVDAFGVPLYNSELMPKSPQNP